MKAWLKGGLIGLISGALLYVSHILAIFMSRAFGPESITKTIRYVPFYFTHNVFLHNFFEEIGYAIYWLVGTIGLPLNSLLIIINKSFNWPLGSFNWIYLILFTIYCFFVGILINKLKEKKIALINGGLIGAGAGLLIGFLILILLGMLGVPVYDDPYALYILGSSIFFWVIFFITGPFLIYYASSVSLLITMMLIFTIIGTIFNEIKSKKGSQRNNFLKEFFRPTRGKIILTLFLIVISVPPVIIFTLGPNRIYFLIFDLGMIVMKYITTCLIIYIYNKIKSRKRNK